MNALAASNALALPRKNAPGDASPITYWLPGLCCCNTRWENAYERFETPEEESAKFTRRLVTLGAARWPRHARIIELFCGRGNGLKALAQLSFSRLEGVDLSPALLSHYQGPARLYVGDCRQLGFDDSSADIVLVQGGLHHLPRLPNDLDRVLAEVHRVLRPGGRLVFVEPWLTTWLRGVHCACRVAVLRRGWGKLDALATMIDEERATYFAWLDSARDILHLVNSYFKTEFDQRSWGKIFYSGTKHAQVGNPAAEKE